MNINIGGHGIWRYDWIHDAMPGLSLEECIFLSWVYSIAYKGQGVARPSVEYIAREITYQSVHSVLRMLKKLEAAGIIEIKRTAFERSEYKLTDQFLSLARERLAALSCRDALVEPCAKMASEPCAKMASKPCAKMASNNIEIHNIVQDNIGNNNIALSAKRRRECAKPETVDEVKAYFDEKGYTAFDHQEQAEAFFDFYSSKGWAVGKSPMKDWKAAARGWAARHKKNGGGYPSRESRADYLRRVQDALNALPDSDVSEEEKKRRWMENLNSSQF